VGLRRNLARPGGRAVWKCGPWTVHPGNFSEIDLASRIARVPVLSSSFWIGVPTSAGWNEIVERPVLSSTETNTRSGRPRRRAVSTVFMIMAPGPALNLFATRGEPQDWRREQDRRWRGHRA